MRYQTVLADPPWTFSDNLPSGDGGVRRAAHMHYRCMKSEDIDYYLRYTPANVIRGAGQSWWPPPLTPWSPLEQCLAPNGFLWLWAPSAFIIDGSATRVARAWGYEPKQIVTWVKGRHTPQRLVIQMGRGHYTRNCTEHLLLCTRGKATRLLKSRGIPNVFVAPRGRHSAKPEESYALIERTTPGPYLELFARTVRPCWHAVGDELPGPLPPAGACLSGHAVSCADLSGLGAVA